MTDPQDERPATYSDTFAVGEFRYIWAGHVLSVLGDQLAQVALALLVFHRTGSPLLSALTYALLFLPQVFGGPLLAGLADMLPRRAIMISCDVLRAGLVAGMAIPGAPLWLLLVLLFFTHLVMPSFAAARAALLPEILTGDRYALGSSAINVSHQAGQVVGFAAGGLIVAFLGAGYALVIDACTFVVSALLLVAGVRERPPATRERRGSSPVRELPHSLATGARVVFGDPRLRSLTILGWLCAFYVVSEGLAAPYAKSLDSPIEDGVATGLIMAALPIGTALGAFVLGRLVRPSLRLRLMGPLAMLSCGALIILALSPGLWITLLVITVAGAASGYMLPANVAFIREVPDTSRGQALGIVQAGMQAGQGVMIVAAGALAKVLAPNVVVALSGAVGLIIAAGAAGAWNRANPSSEKTAAAVAERG